jgi:hypothetical protein
MYGNEEEATKKKEGRFLEIYTVNVFFPNLDGAIVDAPGRREDWVRQQGMKRRTTAGLLTLGWWCSGGTARARCLFSFLWSTFFKERVWSWFRRSGLK